MAGDGTANGFDAGAFRDAIHFAMTMGTPPAPAQQVTFIVPDENTYQSEDPANDPYDWTATPVSTVKGRTTTVLAAVTFANAAPEGSPVGVFDASRVMLTLLDTEWDQVGNADAVLVGGVHYVIDPPGAVPVGLFDVTVYELHASARS